MQRRMLNGWEAVTELNYLHLHHFYVIASEGQIARAAKRLHLGQPTLSTQLKELEENLGFTLFERKRGETLRLTDKGRVTFEYAKRIFLTGDELKEVARGLQSTRRVLLRIGAIDTLPKRTVFRLLRSALKDGNCSVSLYEDNADQLFAKLLAHQYDLVVSTAPAPHSEKQPIQTRLLKRSPVFICGARKFRGLKKGFPRSLEGQPAAFPTQDGALRPKIEDYFTRLGIRFNLIGEAQDAEVLRLLAISGAGFIPTSLATVADDLKHERLFLLGEIEGIHEELWISSSSRLVANPAVHALMNIARI